MPLKSIARIETIKNASFVMAGGACLLILAGHLFAPGGVLPIKGFYFLAALAIPILCLWAGSLIRVRIGKPKWWMSGIVALAMVVLYYCSFKESQSLHWLHIRFQWYGLICLGFLLPWEYLYRTRDKDGIKSIVLCIITALTYCVIDLVNQRMTVIKLPAPFVDLGLLLKTITLYVMPLAAFVPIYFAAMFSYSDAGQWLGRKKWFRWVAGIAAVIVFLALILNLQIFWTPIFLWQIPQVLVQPFTIYLVIVICRMIRKPGMKDMTWKEVFVI